MVMRSVLTVLLMAAASPSAQAMEQQGRGEIRPARDGNIAIRQELDAARKAGTIAAYDLFIARHPRHALAEIARAERAGLVRRVR